MTNTVLMCVPAVDPLLLPALVPLLELEPPPLPVLELPPVLELAPPLVLPLVPPPLPLLPPLPLPPLLPLPPPDAPPVLLEAPLDPQLLPSPLFDPEPPHAKGASVATDANRIVSAWEVRMRDLVTLACA